MTPKTCSSGFFYHQPPFVVSGIEPRASHTPSEHSTIELFFCLFLIYSKSFRFPECVSPACLYVHHMHAWCPWMPEKGVGSPGTRVVDGCELRCRCWNPNPSPLQEKQVLNCWTRPTAPVHLFFERRSHYAALANL